MSSKSGTKKAFLQVDINLVIYRCSHLQMFHKIGVLENFAKFTGQHMCQGPFLIKLEASTKGIFQIFHRGALRNSF